MALKTSSKATINDVARIAGVSIKTVSRVVNAEPNVRPMTRMKVERAIAELNYRPNVSARNLASARTRLIVLIYDDPAQYAVPSSGYVTSLQEGALRACRATGHELLIHPCSYGDPDIHEELERLIERTRPGGVVLAAPLSNMPHIVDAVRATNVPFVPLATGERGNHEFLVATNDRTLSAEMTVYLASLGHRRIAFIRGNPDHHAVGNRFFGYQDGLAKAGLAYDERLVVSGDNSILSGERAAQVLLESERRPTAIFSANDDMAAGVLRIASRRGLRVPEELSVAGFDDVSLAQQLSPSLTTVYQPLAEMAEAATFRLTEKDEGEHGVLIVPADLRIRESTGPAPGL